MNFLSFWIRPRNMSFSISKWVCPPPETHSEPPTEGAKVEWFRCVPYLAIHALAVLAFSIHLSGLVCYFASFPIRFECLQLQHFTIVIFHTGHSKQTEPYNLSEVLSLVALPSVVHCGGQLITAAIIATLTPTKTCILQKQTVCFGVTPFGL